MYAFLQRTLSEQRPRPRVYVEPFAGGAGAALALLASEMVDRIVLNDLNKGIFELWRAVFWKTDEFVAKISSTPATLEEWHRQREIYHNPSSEGLDLGFATFFLNRTNRSGILGARPIGGLAQDGRWKIDARYNAGELTTRITALGEYRHRVDVSCRDGVQLVTDFSRCGTEYIFNVDPPYLIQGEELYLNTLHWDDHVRLAQALVAGPPYWIVTYDTDSRVPDVLYPNQPCATFGIAHTAAIQHIGTEYLVTSDQLRVSDLSGIGRRTGHWLPGREPLHGQGQLDLLALA